MSNNKPLRLPIELFDFPDAGEYCLYCLPRVGADALLSMSHRMLWDIFTDADGKIESVSPEQRQYLEDTIEGLIMPCTFPDYSQQLSDIAVALSQIQITANCAPDITVSCGSDSNFIVYPDPASPPIINPGPLPDTPIDPDNPIPYPPDFPIDPLDPEGDPPAGWETWESYDADACAAANAIVEYAYQYARQNKDFFGQDVYTLAAIIVVVVNILTLGFAVLFSRALIVKIGEVIWKMANWLPLEAAEEFFQDMENYIQANRQDLVCTLYESRLSGSNGMNNFLASVFGFASGTAAYIANASLVTELLGYIFPPSLFAGSIVGGIAYTGANAVSCESCGNDGPPGMDGLLLIKVPLTGTYTVSESTGTVSSTISIENDVVHMSTYGGGNVYRFSVNTPVSAARLLSEHGVTLNVTHKIYCAVVLTEVVQITPGRYPEVVQMAGVNSSGISNAGYAANGPMVIRYQYVSTINLQAVYDWATENGGHSTLSGMSGASGAFVQWGHYGLIAGPITADIKLTSYWYLLGI